MSDIVLTTQTTPATPGSGKAVVFVDSSTKQIESVNDAGTVATYLTEAGHNVAPAVHGLPANVNVLGNRSAAGEFVQRGSGAGTSTGTSRTMHSSDTPISLTFPVAFNVLQSVVATPIIGVVAEAGAILSPTTTGFSFVHLTDYAGSGYKTFYYIAIGT